MLFADQFLLAQELKWLASLDADAYEDWQAEAEVDVEHVGSNSIGNSHVPKSISCH